MAHPYLGNKVSFQKVSWDKTKFWFFYDLEDYLIRPYKTFLVIITLSPFTLGQNLLLCYTF